MADAVDIAILTDRIAKAIREAHETVGNVARTLDETNFDRTLGRRLSEVTTLQRSAETVKTAEAAADLQGLVAQGRDNDPAEMEKWLDADQEVRGKFGDVQVAAGGIASQIGAGQRHLESVREDLFHSSGQLDRAMRDVALLEGIPDYAEAGMPAELRGRVERLQKLVTGADNGLEGAIGELEVARLTAGRFERTAQEVGDNRHSNAVLTTSATMQTRIESARSNLQDLGDNLSQWQPHTADMAAYGQGVANVADREARQQADLAAAARAGTNPTSQSDQQVAGGNGEQDLRSRLDGTPSKDSGVKKG